MKRIFCSIEKSISLSFLCLNDQLPCSIKYLPLKQLHRSYSSVSSVNLNNLIKSRTTFTSQLASFSRFSSAHMMASSETFRLSDYDCFGFDLDNTLVQYKIAEMVKMEYEGICKYLIEQKGYPAAVLQQEIDYDFLQKGLILDFENGNLLKLNWNGTIAKAAHGTHFLNETEIKEIYGKEKRWSVTNEYVDNFLATWNGPLADRMRALLDYFDMPASLIFGRMVDYIDKHDAGQKYDLWPDILEAIRDMYAREHFSLNSGEYFPKLKSDPGRYVHKASPELLKWLKEVREKKTTFLITGSHIDFADCTASWALGDNWRDYFDLVICFARKPGFFTSAKPFVQLNGIEETLALQPEQLKLGEIYSQGNWRDLYPLLQQKTKNPDTQFLYFGDNLIQDVHAPAKYTKCDTVVVVEEMLGEGMKGYDELHPDCVLLASKKWGSFFSNDGEHPTVWADLIEKYSKICIPSVETLAKYPFDYQFNSFTNTEHSKGFYPSDPIHTVK